jgi:hypothetical protein
MLFPSKEEEELLTTPSSELLTTPSNDDKNNKNKLLVQLEFSDFLDLQTRLVLLPRVEDEGRCAILSSYSHSHPFASPEEDGPSKEHRDDEESTDTTKLTGSVLVGMVGQLEDEDDGESTTTRNCGARCGGPSQGVETRWK